MGYDDDQYAAKQHVTLHLPELTNNDANAVLGRLQFFHKAKILDARAEILRTSYDIATSTLQIYVDDSSIGAIVLTTETVGTIIDADLTETTIASTSSIELQQDVATMTGDCLVTVEYQELFE